MAANTFRNNTSKTVMTNYVQSILQCNVVLDRLEQSEIDQIMQNSVEDDNKFVSTTVRIFFITEEKIVFFYR